MPDWTYWVIFGIMMAIARLLGAALLATLLWAGYQVLPNRAGKILFGHYWKEHRARRRVQDTHTACPDSGADPLGK